MGAPGRGIPSDEVLRTALQRAWEKDDASLYTLERDIGRSPAGLLKFLNGAAPRPATRKKLLDWYVTQPPVEDEPDRVMAELLFSRMLPSLADDDRARLLRALATRAGDAYRRRDTAPPRWITELGESTE
ncbi:MAG TPA: hypothetical protein VF541_17980 [Longimicrobium sp.]|jgi:hypothetical protein